MRRLISTIAVSVLFTFVLGTGSGATVPKQPRYNLKPLAGHFKTSGRASVFNDGATTASTRGGGISTWFYGRLNGYWLIRAPNGIWAIWRQNDNGPAADTGRWLDITPSAVGSFGYGYYSFPTDEGSWHGEFLGYRLPRGLHQGRQHGGRPYRRWRVHRHRYEWHSYKFWRNEIRKGR